MGAPNRKQWQWQLGDLQEPSEMHGRPQVQQPLRLGAYAMQLIVDAAVIELEAQDPRGSPVARTRSRVLGYAVHPLSTT